MKYNVKKLIATFMAATLIAAGTANYILVGAEGLANTGVVPYNNEKAQFILDGAIPTAPAPEVTMGIVVEEDVPPAPEYDLTLDWGAMALKYTFTFNGTNEYGTLNLTGGSWGDSFDGTNNQIKITNNSTTQEIQGSMIYSNVDYSRVDPTQRPEGSENIDEYDVGITLASYDSTASSYINPTFLQQYTLAMSGNAQGLANYATFYIYDEDDLYTKVNNSEMPAPTESIADLKVGMITVEANYKM